MDGIALRGLEVAKLVTIRSFIDSFKAFCCSEP
jgi:hypothetical protein